ncbi:AarF/UbiB family protein [Lederbergia citrea]|uniref:AarF/UbiB family protein n=1 Tax=Lederbergia citrea TaxID=2833581 RepID=UPI001BC92221|nr:AarF/UbiB family protein [Lederbergia citrea]MBS4204418.1 serine/threonine protein kinase [Lederbergia citrea]
MYAKERHCLRESEALKIAQVSSIVPKVFEVGANYIVMEYIKGQPLKDYLGALGSIPESIVKQLIFVFKEMKKVGFTRVDEAIRHFIVTDNGEIKVIDHVNSLTTQKAWPNKFCGHLAKLNLLDAFLYQVKKSDRELFSEWEKWL